MRLHILGICGTFMAGLARLARELGYEVTGSDANVYPPMSTQLEQAGISLLQGYKPEHLQPAPDLVVVGNAMSRGNPAVEYMLNAGLPYVSGPQWLAEHVLQGRWVLAVSGTHGKTTTTSLLAWILECAGLAPGFLVGGVPSNFAISARLGESPFFVVEADEYDSAFFDKRSKFVHYRPRTLILNNLEFDHADIFADVAAIQRQFHHLVRTVPGEGLLVCNADDAHLTETLAMGCWTPRQGFSARAERLDGGWSAKLLQPDASEFEVVAPDGSCATVRWSAYGQHNLANALAALAAARHVGVPLAQAVEALSSFQGVARRMQVLMQQHGITIYDDFAHHPTAIRTTLEGLRARVGSARILVAFEPRSNTMRMGVHQAELAAAFALADSVYLYVPPDLSWDVQPLLAQFTVPVQGLGSVEAIAASLVRELQNTDHLVVMSNGSFNNLHDQLISGINRS